MGDGRLAVFASITAALMLMSIIPLSGNVVYGAPGDETYTEPDISIEFHKDIYVVDPHPYDGGNATITAKLICDIPESVPSNIYCTIFLVPISETAVSMRTDPFTFNKLFPVQEISLHVQVVGDLKGNVTIPLDLEARWEYPRTRQGGSEMFHTNLTIPPHGWITGYLPLSREGAKIDVGPWNTFLLDVHNNMNMETNMEFIVAEGPSEFEVEFEPANIRVQAHQRKTINMKIRQRSGSDLSTSITIGVRSDLPGEYSYQEFEIDVRSSSRDEEENPFSIILIVLFLASAVVILALIWAARKKGRRPERDVPR